ncbi:MAG: helix-turn-helix transcriptional regulator [SAR324 cluster bacterium]|nr:helix-turn-helix transcriptional regulator [SAR324 cluster bacterium]
MDKIELGNRLALWREQKNWSQKDFAKKLRVSLLTIQHWEDGISAPAQTRFNQISAVLGVSLTDMGLADDLDPQFLGDRIRFARLLRGFSIEKFAYEFGFTIQTVKGWENRNLEISEIALARISKALQLPPVYFSLKTSEPFQMIQRELCA